MHVYLSKKNIGDNVSIVFPLFQDVGALGNSHSYAGLQSLPDKFWAVERWNGCCSESQSFARKAPVIGCGRSVFQKKLLVAQRQFACV